MDRRDPPDKADQGEGDHEQTAPAQQPATPFQPDRPGKGAQQEKRGKGSQAKDHRTEGRVANGAEGGQIEERGKDQTRRQESVQPCDP